MGSQTFFKGGALAVCFLFITACAQLPEYARPRIQVPPVTDNTEVSGFTYRPLAITDFQAASLPPDYEQYRMHLKAKSCITIKPSRDTSAAISRSVYYGDFLYVGTFTQIFFEALFIPECSWWNPDIAEDLQAYVLQHEQIHFALSELTARRISREMNGKINDFNAIGSTPEEVKQGLLENLVKAATAEVEADLAVHLDFDRSTSMFYAPEAQNSWYEKVEKRLAEERPQP